MPALYSAFTNYASYADERNGFCYETQAMIPTPSAWDVSRKLPSRHRSSSKNWLSLSMKLPRYVQQRYTPKGVRTFRFNPSSTY